MPRRRTRRGGQQCEAALAHYDTERRQFGRSLVARARYLGAYLEAHQTQNEEERRQTHLTRDPASFMRDYGAEELIDKRTNGGNPIAEEVVTGRPRRLSRRDEQRMVATQ